MSIKGGSVEVHNGMQDLAPVPAGRTVTVKRFLRSLVSRDAWIGDHDYAAMLIPTLPCLKRKAADLPFYGVNDKLPYLLTLILGLQHALAMVGGVITPPLLLGGASGAALGTDATQYLISASLIWCGLGTALQVSRTRLGKTRYFLGTGIISVTGTSFAFVNVGLSYLSQAYENGTCPKSPTGAKLPCPEEFGALLGTACLTGLFCILMAFIPPKAIRRLFPPMIVGMMLFLIGAALVKSGVTNWAGGAGPCSTDHTMLCPSNTATVTKQYWGSAPLIGLGFSSFATIILCELFGSPFIKSASVFLGLIVGMVIAAATGYFNSATINSSPAFTFLWVQTFPLRLRGQLVLPMLAAWTVISAETIGNVTASCDVSRLPIEGEEFETRVQGGMLADSLSASLAGLAMVPPLTTFSQNSGVIAITRNASRKAGFVCAALLFTMGVVAKFASIFAAMPSSVLGGFVTFLFGSVAVSGIRVMAYAKWDRRTRFIATCGMSLGLASLCVPTWFSYFFTYSGNNSGLTGLIQAVVLIVEEPYLISSLIAIFLNVVLPQDKEEGADDAQSLTNSTEDASTEDAKISPGRESETWNQPGPVLARH